MIWATKVSTHTYTHTTRQTERDGERERERERVTGYTISSARDMFRKKIEKYPMCRSTSYYTFQNKKLIRR